MFDFSLVGIAGSFPAGVMNVCPLSVLCCQVEVSASARVTSPRESWRGWWVCVRSSSVDNEDGLVHRVLSSHEKNRLCFFHDPTRHFATNVLHSHAFGQLMCQNVA